MRRGAAGEAIARAHLERLGYTHIVSNWRCAAGELDLVMRDGTELVLVEVKTRRGEAAGRAEESIGGAKARKLLAAGEWYVAQLGEVPDPVWRIDLVAITLDAAGNVQRLRHEPNAVISG